VLDVPRSGFYAWCERAPSAHARRDDELGAQAAASFAASRRRYGSPRVYRDLRAQGVRTSRKRVARLMRTRGLRARRPRSFRKTTDSRHDFPVAPNLLERDFTTNAPNEVWVADITYVPTGEGWLYVAIVVDLFARRGVGWAARDRITRHLALAALDQALTARDPPRGRIHHSDRGSPYASDDYRAALRARGIECSMSRKGDCWDNAVAESFFGTFKNELVNDAHFASRAEATATIREYIEGFYNCQRRHSTLDYVSPLEYELRATKGRAA
jgi:transposase InsO family protein